MTGRGIARADYEIAHAGERRRPGHLGRALAQPRKVDRARLRSALALSRRARHSTILIRGKEVAAQIVETPFEHEAPLPRFACRANANSQSQVREDPTWRTTRLPKSSATRKKTSGYGDDADEVVIGVTDFAQNQLGDIVFVELPEVGSSTEAGAPFGTIESVKAVSDLFAPLSGEVTRINESLEEQPELVNEACYGDGWLLALRPSNPAELEDSWMPRPIRLPSPSATAKTRSRRRRRKGCPRSGLIQLPVDAHARDFGPGPLRVELQIAAPVIQGGRGRAIFS